MSETIRQASVIVASADSNGWWLNVLSIGTTFVVALVALFQERIKQYFNRAVLDMEINLAPPDCHKIAQTNNRHETIGWPIYIRIRVNHKGGSTGENVEIMPVKFWRVEGDGRLVILKQFLPISLVWSHFQPRTNVARVPVGLFRHCDFGYFMKSEGGAALLVLDTMVQPNPVANGKIPNVIEPGKYQFELLLSGDNVKVLKKKWELEFREWSDSEELMLTKNIKIREV